VKRAMQTLAAYAGVFVILFAMAIVGGIEGGW
jgi:hypothetical protein